MSFQLNIKRYCKQHKAVGLLLALAIASAVLVAGRSDGGCRGLKPFNNLEELLYQFYVNLDSGCMFKMKPSELEKIWGVKILPQKIKILPQEKVKFEATDAFYLEQIQSKPHGNYAFIIRITDEYHKEYGTLFPDGNFPELLPKPCSLPVPGGMSCNPDMPVIQNTKPGDKPGSFLGGNPRCVYYWLNSDQTASIGLGSDGYGMVHYIYVIDYVFESHRLPDKTDSTSRRDVCLISKQY